MMQQPSLPLLVMSERLEDKIEEYLQMLPDCEEDEWFGTCRELATIPLRSFLWWLFPQLRPEDVNPWEELSLLEEVKDG